MTGAKVLVGGADRKDPRRFPGSPEQGWYLVGGLGFAFSLVAAADIALAFIPQQWGSAEWEFGTIVGVMGSVHLLAFGVVLALGAGMARGRRQLTRFWAVMALGLAVAVLVAGGIFVRHIPVALASSTDSVVVFGIKKAIFRVLSEVGVYVPVLGWLGFKGLRASFS